MVEALNSRERVKLILEHKEADRIPVDLGGRIAPIRHEAYSRLVEYLKLERNVKEIKIDPFLFVLYPDIKLLDALGIDFHHIYTRGPEYIKVREYSDGGHLNEWGISVKTVDQYAQRVTHPLSDASIDDIEKYNWPDVKSRERHKGLRQFARHLFNSTDFSLVADPVSAGIFEMAQHLRGPENFYVDLMLNKDFAHTLLDKILDVYLQLTEGFLEEVGSYIDIVALISDDYGSNESLLVSPELFDEFFAPRYRKLIKIIKSKFNARVLWHTDGAVFNLIDRLIDMGVDILNPIQPTAKGMEHSLLKETFGSRISFHGGIDSQYVLAWGTPEEISRYVKDAVSKLAPGGGYILAASHGIQYQVPPENIVAMYDAAKKCGVYQSFKTRTIHSYQK